MIPIKDWTKVKVFGGILEKGARHYFLWSYLHLWKPPIKIVLVPKNESHLRKMKVGLPSFLNTPIHVAGFVQKAVGNVKYFFPYEIYSAPEVHKGP
jgi:hypothetical protein